MERLLADVGGTGRREPGLMALIGKEQLAHKFELRAGEVVTHAVFAAWVLAVSAALLALRRSTITAAQAGTKL
jgi:hypothetical protein